MRHRHRSALVQGLAPALALGLALASAAGCAGESTTGSVDLSLVGQSPSGTHYRLRGATVMVQGPNNTIFFNTDENPNAPTLTATVPVGAYFAFLQEGWHLDRINSDNTGTEVVATLTSGNRIDFQVAANQQTNVFFHFRVGGEVVDMDQGSFGVGIDIDEADGMCQTDADCSTGQTCCLAGFLGTCTTLAAGQACPLPDLTVSAETAAASLSLGFETFPSTSCAIVEGCVAAPGERRLLRFSTQTPNVGAADMILGDPTSVPGFVFSSCHGHYHFEGYAAYELIDAATGAVAATGHKQAFCLLDSSPVGIPGSPTSPRFNCSFQGIQRGWSDVYGSGLDCQWVDVTGVPAGNYTLRITINNQHTLPESNYDNNTAEIPVTITSGDPQPPGDPLAACTGVTTGANRNCGWSVAAGYQSATCTPGQSVTLGCGCTTATCVGDPMLRVCDGDAACIAAAAIAQNDDSCGLCSQVSFVCPTSGVYTVLSGPYNSSLTATCNVNAPTTP